MFPEIYSSLAHASIQIVAPKSNPAGQDVHLSIPSHVAQLEWQDEQTEVEPLLSLKNLSLHIQDPFYKEEFGAQTVHYSGPVEHSRQLSPHFSHSLPDMYSSVSQERQIVSANIFPSGQVSHLSRLSQV